MGVPEVCWQCDCTKGTGDVAWSYCNLDPGAPWRRTFMMHQPWLRKPTLAYAVGFQLSMVAPDILHTLHIGWGRDVIGAALKVLCAKRGYFTGGNQDERLQEATRRLKEYARQHRLTLVISKLCKKSISWTSNQHPEVKCKGWDTYVILRWLAWEIANKPCSNTDLNTAPK